MYSNLRLPTIKEFKWALRYADNDIDKSRDTTQLMKFLIYIANHNGRLKGHINARIAAISSWEWEIIDESGEKSIITNEVESQLREAIQKIPKLIVNISLYGNMAAGLTWKLDERNIQIPSVSLIRPDHMESYDDGTVVIKTLDNKRLILAPDDDNYLQATDGADLRGGIMRSVGEIDIIRHDMINEWANYNKKLKGMLQGIDKGGDEEEHEKAVQAMRLSMENAWLLTSDMIDFKFHQLAATTGTSFKDLVDSLNATIAIAIMGQANTSQLPNSGGSRAALQIQQLISADIMWGDIQLYERIVNKQLLTYEWRRNMKTGVPPYKFHVIIDEIDDYEQNAIVIREALNLGIPLAKDAVYEKIGFRVPKAGEKVFQISPSNSIPVIPNINKGA